MDSTEYEWERQLSLQKIVDLCFYLFVVNSDILAT
jgi:hypothetical protein